jgi:membrane fusion protein (multidrug efflux system)
MDRPSPTLFRQEALAHRRAQTERAEVLALDPAASSWASWVIGLGLALGLLFLWFGRLNEYATGPAMVRLEGRTTLSAKQAGVVTAVYVTPGQHVAQGDLIVQLYAADESAELEAAQRELEHQLHKLLQKPDDETARQALVSLRVRRELAETRLAQRTVRAPRHGTIGDVRVREGQLLEPGVIVAEMHDPTARASVSALLPGRYRPFLASGHKLRFRLDGFHREVLELTVLRAGDQIVGPREATRFLGADLADAVQIEGPVVLVEAELPRGSFRADGAELAYAHGMLGSAEAVVRDERVLYALLPVLKPAEGDQGRDREWDLAGLVERALSWAESVKGKVSRAW